MKKLYSLFSVLLLGSVTVFGQISSVQVAPRKNHTVAISEQKVPKLKQLSNASARIVNPNNHTAGIIWSDDFSNPGNWIISNDVGNTDDWVIGTTGPSGLYAINPIASTSSANGFALYDSDLMCSGDQIGNLTNATPINCTGHPTVRVRFEQYYRRFVDSTYLYVSNDNVNWTLFPVNASLAVNAFVASNPTVTSVDISSVAGNQATVYVRFTFYSPASLGTGAGCAYSWMVDDVVVEDLPSDDVSMVPSFPGPYTGIPLSQVQSIDLAGQVANVGLATETNVGFDIYVLKYDYTAGMYQTVTNFTSPAQASLNAGDTSAVLSAGSFTPADSGLYAFAYLCYMDNTDNDTVNDFSANLLYVSDTIYARDNALIYGGNPDQVIQYNSGGNGSFAQMYEAFTPVTITSVTTLFASHTVGDEFTVSIHSMSGGVPDQMLGVSPSFIATSADTGGAFMTFELSPPVTMNPGQFAVSFDQITTDPIGLAMYDDVATSGTTFYGTTGAWALLDTVGLYTGSPFFTQTFLLRPNLDINTSVQGIKYASGVSIYPNPSHGKIYIMNNGSASDMTVNVTNNMGQIVYSNKYNRLSTSVVDLTNQPAGVYTVQVISDSGITTKSVVISNK